MGEDEGAAASASLTAGLTPAVPSVRFGAAVRALRLHAGLSLNALARQAGIDPAYVLRIERGAGERAGGAPAIPRRPVVEALGRALGLSGRQVDDLLVRAGYAPGALLDLGGWGQTLAEVADVLLDPAVPSPDKAELREVLSILCQRWARGSRG